MIILSIPKVIQLLTLYGFISPLDTKYFISNEIREGFERLRKNGFFVFQVNIRNKNKNL